MHRLALACLVCSFTAPVFAVPPDPKALEIPAPDTLRARELVRRLGSESYLEREQAHQDLARMGRLAKPALVEAVATTPDPEIRRRVARLLPRASDEDLKARVAAFLADSEGKFEHHFPGWKSYRTIVGNTSDARSLFADMIKDGANVGLLGALDGPPEDLAKRFAERRQEIWSWKYPPRAANAVRREPAMADLAVLLLVESTALAKQGSTGITVGTMLSNTSFYSGGTTGPRGEIFKKLMGRWALSRHDMVSLYQALTVANRYELKETAECAGKLLGMPRTVAYYQATALATIARLEARDQLPAIEKCLGDETVYTRARVVGMALNESAEIRLQDTALAAALIVTGQKLEDYGFKEWNTPGSAALKSRYINRYLSAEDRAAAFEKWAAWRKKNPDAKK